MKKLVSSVLCCAAAISLNTASASGGYLVPRVAPARNTPSSEASLRPASALTSLAVTHAVTSAKDSGPGTLRDAINSSAPGDVITFALKLPATIELAEPLVIGQDIIVHGPGPDLLTVMRSRKPHTPSFGVIEVEAGVVTLAGVSIENGIAFSGTNIHDNLGGGILNRGILTVSNCVVTGNSAPTTDWGTNVPDPNFRFSVGFGAGIFSDTGSQLAIVNSTISGNQASGAGGAVCTHYVDRFVAVGSTLNCNSADAQGGGVNFQGLTGIFQNCTISGNSTLPDGAGSAYLLITFAGELANLTLTACTVAGNHGSTNGACILAALPGNAGLTNRLLSTLVANNTGPNFFLDGNPVLESLGHNLDNDGTSGLANGVNGDLVGTTASPIDPKLSPLQDNGGPTLTMALLPGSPALGAGACTDAEGAPLTVDQRGLPRPQVTGCDIGAFENQAPELICPVAQTLKAAGHGSAKATLTATVADPDGDALTVIWSVNGVERKTNHIPASHPPRSSKVKFKDSFPVGTNTVGVVVSDSKAVPMGCSTTVIVRPKK